MGKEEEVLRRLKEIEGMKQTYQVCGLYDIIAKIEAESTEKVEEVVQGSCAGLPKSGARSRCWQPETFRPADGPGRGQGACGSEQAN